MTTPTTQPKKSPTAGRTMQGEVVRRSGDKTIAVVVRQSIAHPKYLKRQTVTQTYLVHDQNNEAQVGQVVTIRESRPLSRQKRWILVK